MNEAIKIAIEGYNAEKLILTKSLKEEGPHVSETFRLKEIDKCIKDLLDVKAE